MENYIINNNTVAILKNKTQTIIFNVENKQVININIKKFLNYNCKYFGSSFKGRQVSSKLILKICYKVPIIINNGIILLQIHSLRKDKCLFIVLNKIIDYEYQKKKLKIKCVNNITFYVNISKYSFEKMLLNSLKLQNIIINQNNTYFV